MYTFLIELHPNFWTVFVSNYENMRIFFFISKLNFYKFQIYRSITISLRPFKIGNRIDEFICCKKIYVSFGRFFLCKISEFNKQIMLMDFAANLMNMRKAIEFLEKNIWCKHQIVTSMLFSNFHLTKNINHFCPKHSVFC